MWRYSRKLRNCGSFLLAAAILFVVAPLLSAQTAKELISDACYNEIQQHKRDMLWTNQIERRENGHVYLEREIETHSGSVHRLFLVDGHVPSPSERKSDDDRLRVLMKSPRVQETMRKSQEADKKKAEDLLSLIPQAFLFEDQGKQGNLQKLGFHPNPAYKPTSFEETALRALTGYVLIDLQEKRLVELSAVLTQQVDFGLGLLGSLKKGGSVDVKRTRVQSGIWKTSSTKINVSGHIVLIKAINKKQDETQSHFTSVSSDISVDQAIKALLESGSIDSTEALNRINF